MTFQPGQSGNPGGRKPDEFGPVLRAFLGKRAAKGQPIRRDVAMRAVYQAAVDGDMKAMAILLDRAYGKVAVPVEHSGPDGGPLVIRWADADSE